MKSNDLKTASFCEPQRLGLGTVALVAVAGLALFLPRITIPPSFVFDEIVYVPAARELVARTINPEISHPPLAKLLIATGIAIAGDNPFGWRLMSALAGTLSLCAIYVWVWLLARERRLAGWAVAITAINNLLYVVARTAILDIFAAVFLLWALVAVTAVMQGRIGAGKGLASAGALFGLANACKWFALAPLVAMLVLVLVWRSRQAQARISAAGALLSLILVPVLVYCAAFAVLAWRLRQPMSLAWLIEQQLAVIRSQVGHQGPLVQISRWYTWPGKLHPEAFYFGQQRQVVLLLGNPVVMWTGLLAVLVLIFTLVREPWWTERWWTELIVVVAYASVYGQWSVAPRRTMFYHYYFPAAMVLGPALALAFAHRRPQKIFGMEAPSFLLSAATAIFVISFPVLSAIHTGAEWIIELLFH